MPSPRNADPGPAAPAAALGRLALSLKARIPLFLVALLLAVQGAAFLLIDRANRTHVDHKVAQELVDGEAAFRRRLVEHREEFERAGVVLAGDFAFRQALATHDRPTILRRSPTRRRGWRRARRWRSRSTTA